MQEGQNSLAWYAEINVKWHLKRASTDKAQNLPDNNSGTRPAIVDYRDQIFGQFYGIIVITILLIQYYTPPKPHFSTWIPIICQNARNKWQCPTATPRISRLARNICWPIRRPLASAVRVQPRIVIPRFHNVDKTQKVVPGINSDKPLTSD